MARWISARARFFVVDSGLCRTTSVAYLPITPGTHELDDEYATGAGLCGDRDYRRADLRAMLLAQQAAWGAPAAARQRIDELCRPDGLAVCTGSRPVSSAAPCSPCTRR